MRESAVAGAGPAPKKKRTKPRRGSGLWPREHGAYAQLIFPLLTVVVLGGASAASLLFSVCLVAGFLANEPLLVLMGHRGKRARDDWAGRARVRAGWLSTLAAASGLVGLWLSSSTVRWSTVPLGLAALVIAWLATTKREKTGYGEGFVAATLAYSSVPVALAGGLDVRVAVAVACVWAISYWLGLATVHAVLRRAKRGDGRLAVAVIVASSLVAVAAGVVAHSGHTLALGAIPTAVAGVGVLIARVGPKQLRTVGWSLVTANLVTLAVFVLSPR